MSYQRILLSTFCFMHCLPGIPVFIGRAG